MKKRVQISGSKGGTGYMEIQTPKKDWLDKYGYPVERIKGRPFINFIRLLIHARKRGYYRTDIPVDYCNTQTKRGEP